MQRIHCSYHKCLTVYYQKVMKKLYRDIVFWRRDFKHCYSHEDQFYDALDQYTVISLNNHTLDLERLGEDACITRFVRDPRDLVISGYFYHRRGAEPWCTMIGPNDADWKVVNGRVPEGMRRDESYCQYLNRLSLEDGLMAEIEFRTYHFQSMREWPRDDTRIALFRYEDIIGNEAQVFDSIFRHYRVPLYERLLGVQLAKRHAAGRAKRTTAHVRNPAPEQWREYFTSDVLGYFEAHYCDLPEIMGYPSS